MSTQRQPKGTPTGGQFAASVHDEATTALSFDDADSRISEHVSEAKRLMAEAEDVSAQIAKTRETFATSGEKRIAGLEGIRAAKISAAAEHTAAAEKLALEARERLDYPPTRREVDDAKAYLDSLSVPRKNYRSDWERINGGSGPTVAQVRGEANAIGESRSRRAEAQRDYDRLLAAWEASDKSQDDDDGSVRCEFCGEWYDEDQDYCTECGR